MAERAASNEPARLMAFVNFSKTEGWLATQMDRSFKLGNENYGPIYKTINKLGFAKAANKLSISSSSSQGGNMGWISSKSFNNNILKSIVKSEIGTVTKPIKQETSILILKINDKKNYKTERQDVNKLKDLIVRQKKEEKLKLFSRSHFASIESNILINFE